MNRQVGLLLTLGIAVWYNWGSLFSSLGCGYNWQDDGSTVEVGIDASFYRAEHNLVLGNIIYDASYLVRYNKLYCNIYREVEPHFIVGGGASVIFWDFAPAYRNQANCGYCLFTGYKKGNVFILLSQELLLGCRSNVPASVAAVYPQYVEYVPIEYRPIFLRIGIQL